MNIELNNTNLFACCITVDSLKFTRKVNDKLYTIVVPIESKTDAFDKLMAISNMADAWFIELVELAERVKKESMEEIRGL